jgi:hypothetical protein
MREFSEVLQRSSVIGTRGILNVGKPTKADSTPLNADASAPLVVRFVPSDPSKPRRISPLFTNPVDSVLAVCGKSQVGLSVVQPIAVGVINHLPSGSLQDESVQIPTPAVGIFPAQQAPLVCEDALGVLSVNDGVLALGEGNQNSATIVGHADLLSLCAAPPADPFSAGVPRTPILPERAF